jgi:hypothetical protein
MKELLIDNIYRELKPGSTRHYNYFIYRECNTCSKPYYAKKAGEHYTLYCSALCAGRVRGRPVGTILSTGTKKKIAESRTAKKHSPATKQAISESIHKVDFSKLPPKKIKDRKPHDWRPARFTWRWNKPRCQEWDRFANYYEWIVANGWKPGLVVSRLDKTKPFAPDNVVIRTKSEHSGTTLKGRGNQ